MSSISELILHSLIKSPGYVARAFPYIKEEHFERYGEQVLFRHIRDYINKYQTAPTLDVLYVELTNDQTINEHGVKDLDAVIGNIKGITEEVGLDWIVDTSEKHIQKRELQLALDESIQIMAGNVKDKAWGTIPEVLTKALGVSFSISLGHDYIDDAAERFDYYHQKSTKIPFDIDILDKSTLGGVQPQTLNLLLSGPHGGKSAMLCALAATYLKQGKNVLYVTCEMSKFETGKRIDANLLDIAMEDIIKVPRKTFENSITSLKSKTHGKLIIEEYAAGECSINHIRALFNELWLKKQFKCDILIVDYLNIMMSCRVKSRDNSYLYHKSISEELRSIGQQFKIPVWSATQFNRSGASGSDPTMADISESFGVVMTADYSLALISSDELKQKQQMLCSQLKSRYDDINKLPKFLIGFDRQKMRFYDLMNPTQTSVAVTKSSDVKGQEEVLDILKSEIKKVDAKSDKFDKIDFN